MVQFTNEEEKKIKQLIILGLNKETAEEFVISQREKKNIGDMLVSDNDTPIVEPIKPVIKPVHDRSVKNDGVTTIESLVNYAGGKIVRLPDFAEDQPFIARLKRPSMLAMSKSGKIPNHLLSAANDLFTGSGAVDTDNADMLKELYEVCRVICEASLVSPTLEEIESAGLELTDEQMIAIFNYSQSGVKSLETFR